MITHSRHAKRWTRTSPLLAALAGLAVATAACLPQTPSPMAPQSRADTAPPAQSAVAKGKQLAEMYCAACHAIGVDGASPTPQAPAFRTLSSRYSLSALEEALAEGILVGHPMMPEFKFNPDQIDSLIAYLATVQEKTHG